jgi:hypothetical protein
MASLALLCCASEPGRTQPVTSNAQKVPALKSPVYTKLKNLYLTTELVKNGRPNAVIVVDSKGRYRSDAELIQQALQTCTGIQIPIVTETDARAAVPFQSNLILPGNRSTNSVTNKLYDRFYTLTDLKYPGRGGYEVRTLHNPFGNGFNAVLLGGSDDGGVSAAAKQFVTRINGVAGQPGAFAIGHLMDIKLGEGLVPPKTTKDFKIWEASLPGGYGDTGYFGWNIISKRLAMYHMTGDEFHAREAIRLSFPDAKAIQEITDDGGELIENKNDPLAGPYHYAATHMMLMWDLVEESPAFSDAERLKVTNAFSRQLEFREKHDEGGVYFLTQPNKIIGSRHATFSALSMYCLARYFSKDYPDAVWQHTLKAVDYFMDPLKRENPWVNGENDNLFWYSTVVSSLLSYRLLSGDDNAISPAVLSNLLRVQEVIMSGVHNEPNIRFDTLEYYNKLAYLTGDGRWLTYRSRLGIDANVFRLGQSYWPDNSLQPAVPADLLNRWTISRLPPAYRAARATGFSDKESFTNASFRTTGGADGDFLLIDGLNGAGRNAYHTFAILDLRINGKTLLLSYLNQVMTKADGMVEPKVALDAALRFSDVIGPTAVAVGETPGAPYSNWTRTIAQRTGRYALVVDNLGFRTDSQNFEAQFLWQRRRAEPWTQQGNSLLLKQTGEKEPSGQIAYSDAMEFSRKDNVIENVAVLKWQGAVKQGTRRKFFALVGPHGSTPQTSLQCVRLSDEAVALRLPQPAVAVSGQYRETSGELVVLASDHLFGHNFTRAGLQGLLASSDVPVQLDWDFKTGQLHVVTDRPAKLALALSPAAKLHSNGNPLATTLQGGLTTLALPAGRHTISGAQPAAALLAVQPQQLEAFNQQQPATPATTAATTRTTTVAVPPLTKQQIAPLTERFTAPMQGRVEAYASGVVNGERRFYAANDKTIHAFDTQGKAIGAMQADGAIVVLHWWPEQQLLIAGCKDEKVIAFDTAGQRKWTFISEMDPGVFLTAKQYWFKSAPGYEGVHGLDSGVFLDGKSQLFVGSACTLEILDESGKLVKRLPQYWGPVHKFKLMPKPDGSIDLLMARRLTDRPNLGVINNRKIGTYGGAVSAGYNYAPPQDYRFAGVPPGFTPVNGWMDQTRFHIFHLDVDGDGKKEIVSEITGAWNRVSVWSEDDKPKYTAYFGPGDNAFSGGGASIRFPRPTIRDIDIANVTGDDKPEIVLALASGLIVGLDGKCNKLWSHQLRTTPSLLKIINRKIVVGSENGDVVVLDGAGSVVQNTTVEGRVDVLDRIDDQTVLVGSTGGLKAFSF